VKALPSGRSAVITALGAFAWAAAFGAAPASAVVVTSTADSGPGSLRQAIDDTPASGTVSFDPAVTGTITLTTGELAITKNLTIEGPGARVLRVSGNDASRAFAISGSNVLVTINKLTITNGQTPDGGFENGGGIAVSNGASLVFQDGAVLNSRAGPAIFDASGGGIDVGGGGSLTVVRSTIAGNTAQAESTGTAEGGGISAFTPGDGGSTFAVGDPLVVQNSTVAGNKAISESSSSGGGIDVFGSIALLNSTVAFNSVDAQFSERGGGLSASVDGPAVRTIQASVIASNTVVGGAAGASNDCDSGGTSIDTADTVVGDPSDCDLTGANNVLGTAAPGLTPLANNGGPTDTVALTAASPALNHVAGANCPPPAIDQRGLPRAGGPACESGAWEAQVGLTIDPVSHDFGSVQVGGTTARATTPPFRFTVKNAGDLPANLTTVQTTNSQFAVQPGSDAGRCPVSLAKNATCFVDVSFTPAAVGSTSGALSVASSNAGSVSAQLLGAGFQPDNPPDTPRDPCAPDSRAPKVRITSDQSRTLYGIGQVASITTKASDASGLTSDPSRKRQRITTAKAGSFSIRKAATDKCGNRGADTFRYRVLAGPTARIIHEAAPPGCRTRLLAEAIVESPVALRGAQIFVDGKLKATSSKKRVLRARILTRKLKNGTHSMAVSAVDVLGRRVTVTRTFIIRCS
jgi:hypothetical protein